ncbi:MAG: hypothetical protein ACXVHL_28275 [Solirubrobacteraceae bacterium]
MAQDNKQEAKVLVGPLRPIAEVLAERRAQEAQQTPPHPHRPK